MGSDSTTSSLGHKDDGHHKLFSAKGLSCIFGHGKSAFRAVDRVDFEILPREVVSIVGESGSGKTTLARMLLNLQAVAEGELLFEGAPITDRKAHWRKVQAVFQDPFASFNQFFTIEKQLMSGLKLLAEQPTREEKKQRLEESLRAVNLDPEKIEGKYPFELSGGQMQRLLLARVFMLRPQVLVADEPTSMVDACSRATLLEYLLDLKRKLGMTIVFITHDIGLAYHVSDRLFIMQKGLIVEQGEPDEVILRPKHEYTKGLLQDVPALDRPWLERKRRVA